MRVFTNPELRIYFYQWCKSLICSLIFFYGVDIPDCSTFLFIFYANRCRFF